MAASMRGFLMMPRVIPHCGTEGKASTASECRNNGAVYHSTLNLKNAARSSAVNSKQMEPSTAETESGDTANGTNCYELAFGGKSMKSDQGKSKIRQRSDFCGFSIFLNPSLEG